MHEIKLYGEVVPFQDAWIIEQGGYVNLTYLQNQLKKAKGGDVLVRINSMGGDVDAGLSFYSELRRYAKENNAKITTLAEGQCASIATAFFLAGDERIVTEYTSPFVHNAWTYSMGDSKELVRVADDLEKCNDMIARHYAIHTNLSYEQARELMDASTSISPNEAVELRFATKIEEVLRPVALRRILKTNSNTMAKPKKKTSLKAMFKKALGFQNKIVYTADEKEVDFFELTDEDTPKVGDVATFEGENADGELVMADGKTYVFVDGELTEIKEGESNEAGDVSEEIADVNEKLDEIQEILEVFIEEVVPEIQNLRKDNKRLNAAVDKLKNIGAEPPKGGHERSTNKAKASTLSDAVAEFKKNKTQKK